MSRAIVAGAAALVAAVLAGCATPASTRIKPIYPPQLLGTGTSGRVIAWAYVDAAGNVTRVEIKQSSHALFSEQVAEKLKQWKFEPAAMGPFIGELEFIFNGRGDTAVSSVQK